ncbi:MAG: adenylate/guanylate cyclase domain-containing protein [Acidobacteriota bacterium]
MPTRNLTIMFTDIKGFTARVSAGSRDDLTRLREAHDRLLKPVFAHFGGTIVKTIGDAFLVRFDSPTDGVLCGVAIQEVLRQHAETAAEDDRIEVRVAINSGEVEVVDGDILGEPVNIAARLESAAEAGQVWFTEAVYLAMNRSEAPSAEVGERTFKGIPYPVRVYRVESEPESEFSRRWSEGVQLTERGPIFDGVEPTLPSRASSRRGLGLLALAAVVLAGLATWLWLPSAAEKASARAAELLTAGDPAAALGVAEAGLADAPGHDGLRDVARRAADAQVDRLVDSSGPQVALDWVQARVDEPHLDSLRDRLPLLDTRATVQSIRANPRDESWPALQELLDRHPSDAEVPHLAARLLADHLYPYSPSRLFETALARGHEDPDDAVTAYYFGKFETHPPGHLEIGHDLLAEHRHEETVAWAERALTEAVSGHALHNAWRILKEEKDPRLEQAHGLALQQLLRGYPDEGAADAALEWFETNTPPERRSRLLALHDWILDPPGGWGWTNKHLTERNRDRLAQEWGGS